MGRQEFEFWLCSQLPESPGVSRRCGGSVAKLVADLMVPTSQEESRVPLERKEVERVSRAFDRIFTCTHLSSVPWGALTPLPTGHSSGTHRDKGRLPRGAQGQKGPRQHLSAQRLHLGGDWWTLGLDQPPLPSLPPPLLPALSCLSYGGVKRALDFLTIVFAGCRSILKIRHPESSSGSKILCSCLGLSSHLISFYFE